MISAFLEEVKGRLGEANYFRFCQLLEKAAPGRPPLGSTARFVDDPVRFRPDPGMAFPGGELRSVEFPSAGGPATVRTRFMGLYGVDSPLPTTYMDDIAQRREGHEALEAFLDVFNHRLYTQYYRIWRKYCYPASFEPGGTDATSQCLLGLIGLGIAGTAKQIGTPISRFLALLSVMRLPTRNAEGVTALVRLLAPDTEATVRGHCMRKVHLTQPASLCSKAPVGLNRGTPLGSSGWDINSELLLTLHTDNQNELRQWLPDGLLYRDLLVLLRVYLGWRSTAKLALRTSLGHLPTPLLGADPLRLNMTAVISGGAADRQITIQLGRYQGLDSDFIKLERLHLDRI
jgi:type VI secretion system protein ImpH